MPVTKEFSNWKDDFPYPTEQIKIAKHKGSLRLNVVSGKQGVHFICYSPSMNISSYGNTKLEARKAFEENILTFVDDLLELSEGARSKILREMGWEKMKIVRKQFSKVFKLKKHQIKDIENPEIHSLETAA